MKQSVKSILAVAHDNGGNYVASQTHTLSIAPGSIPAVIEFGSGISDFTFNQGTVDLNISSSGTILGINLPQALGNNFVGSPRVDILGDGTGAEATATVNQAVGSAEYGKITSIQIQNGGIGYDINSTNLKIVPVVRLVGNGTPAEIANPILTDFNETTGNEDFVSQTVLLDTNVDGSSRGEWLCHFSQNDFFLKLEYYNQMDKVLKDLLWLHQLAQLPVWLILTSAPTIHPLVNLL